MTIPVDRSSGQPAIPQTYPDAQLSSPAAPPIEGDSLSSCLMSSKSPTTTPLLSPKESSYSTKDYLMRIHEASQAFRNQLHASELSDVEARMHSSQSAIDSATALFKAYEERDAAIANLESNTQQAIGELEAQLQQMEQETAEQNELIRELNEGNAEETRQSLKLSEAYDKYLQQLQSIGAIDLGNGSYTIPEGGTDAYNAFTREYQQAIANFNSYSTMRQAQIAAYNAATTIYNQNVATYNAYVDDWVNRYNLSTFLADHQATIPHQSTSTLRDLAGYQPSPSAPSLLASTPARIALAPPSPYILTIGKTGIPSLPSVKALSNIDHNLLYQGVHTYYTNEIASLEATIASTYALWVSASQQNWLDQEAEKAINDFLEDSKPLMMKILPDSLFTISHSITPNSQTDIEAIALGGMGTGSHNTANILGKIILQRTLESIFRRIAEETQTGKKEEAAIEKAAQQNQAQLQEKYVDEFLLLSISLLKNYSLRALLPILPLMHSPLPQDSPVFGIAFSLSLINEIAKAVNHDITADALSRFFDDDPFIASFAPEDKSQLTTIVNIGLLLLAAKILELNLGAPRIVANLLAASYPKEIDGASIEAQATKEDHLYREALHTQLIAHFVELGYTQTEAECLAKAGLQLAEYGALAPAATSVNSPSSFDKSILVLSLQAALLLSGHSLETALPLAQETIARALEQGPFLGIKPFRRALESALQQAGVGEASYKLSQEAILVFPKNGAPEKSPFSLLFPQIGSAAKEIEREISLTLFGIRDEGASTLKPEDAHDAWINVLKDQLALLQTESGRELKDPLGATFKEALKMTGDLHPFALAVQSPLYQLMGATYKGNQDLELNAKRGSNLAV